MSRSFQRSGDTIRMQLATWEVELLRELQEGLRATLDDGDPEHPVIARLFPPAVDGDDEADREIRALIGSELLTSRLEGLDALLEVLDRASVQGDRHRVTLREDEPALVLGVLNDLRLAIGARLGIEDLDREEIGPDHPVAPSLAVMDHFAWLQEQLVALLDPAAVKFYDEIDPRDVAGGSGGPDAD